MDERATGPDGSGHGVTDAGPPVARALDVPPAPASPGRRGRARALPRGRQVEADALADVQAALGDAPRRRDLLLEHLHALQDRFGALHPRHMVALAREMRLAMVEVYEVATFYAHFDVLEDGDAAPPPLTLRVCDGLPCRMAGADDLADGCAARAGSGLRVIRAPCLGACDVAPAAVLGFETVTADALRADLARALSAAALPRTPVPRLDAYRAAGGYRLADALRTGALAPEAALDAVEASGLRGMGGAGFPTARKWRLVRAQPGPRVVVVNADESEPGTFKDRSILENDPHRMLEGALIAALVVGADEIVIYLRDEYPEARRALAAEIEALRASGLLDGPSGPIATTLRRGAGAYICGEETALLESLEGKRGLPRLKPPFPGERGLHGRPTLVNNVETLAWLREILENPPGWWAAQGRRGRAGLRLFSLSGRVREPGVKRAPAGITARELIAEFGGGMAEGHAFRAYLPGGASGGLLPAELGDLPLDFGALEPHGAFIGSAAVIVLSDKDDLREAGRDLLRFFADESCGKCTPCRVGTAKALDLLRAPQWDEARLEALARVMGDASICGLGQAAMNGVRGILRHFPGDVLDTATLLGFPAELLGPSNPPAVPPGPHVAPQGGAPRGDGPWGGPIRRNGRGLS